MMNRIVKLNHTKLILNSKGSMIDGSVKGTNVRFTNRKFSKLSKSCSKFNLNLIFRED